MRLTVGARLQAPPHRGRRGESQERNVAGITTSLLMQGVTEALTSRSSKSRIVWFLCCILALALFTVPWRFSPSLPDKVNVCHRVTAERLDPAAARTADYQCAGKSPSGYASQWLWLQHRVTPEQQSWPDWSLNLRLTRFETAVVYYHFADGSVESHQVRNGDFGSYWRPNAYLAFRAYPHAGPLETITIGFHRLAAYDVLRLRLTTVTQTERAVNLTALLLGATLSLLGAAFLYNILLVALIRYRAVLWHAAWLLCMFVWGLTWSQLILLFAPGLAGVASVRLIAMLASLAIFLASQYMLASFERSVLPRWYVIGFHIVTAVYLLTAVLWSFAPAGSAPLLATILRLSTLLVLGLVLIALMIGIVRNSEAAKDFALAWSLPVLAVVASFVTTDTLNQVVMSEQLLVMGTAAMQTLWLSYAATRSFANLRVERDQARARQTELMMLAETDPLTKLYNRRGLTERFRREIAAHDKSGNSLGLMLIDIDHFKSINDTFGHDVGDHTLQRIAELLGALRAQGGIVARLGGEEFCALLPGTAGAELLATAERTRRLLAEADMSMIFGTVNRSVTASFGIVDTRQYPGADASFLIRMADQALYRAKREGRNRVVSAGPGSTRPTDDASSAGGLRADEAETEQA